MFRRIPRWNSPKSITRLSAYDNLRSRFVRAQSDNVERLNGPQPAHWRNSRSTRINSLDRWLYQCDSLPRLPGAKPIRIAESNALRKLIIDDEMPRTNMGSHLQTLAANANGQ